MVDRIAQRGATHILVHGELCVPEVVFPSQASSHVPQYAPDTSVPHYSAPIITQKWVHLQVECVCKSVHRLESVLYRSNAARSDSTIVSSRSNSWPVCASNFLFVLAQASRIVRIAKNINAPHMVEPVR